MEAWKDAAPDRAAQLTWRLRVALDDRPGTLARLAVQLAHRDCNVLAVSVLPVPKGVVDELVISTPAEMLPADLIALVRAEGGRCIGITATKLRDLVDHTTDALRAAARAVATPGSALEALRTVLSADAVRAADAIVLGLGASADGHTPTPTQDSGAAQDAVEGTSGHQVRLVLGEQEVIARRGWAAFTDVELARARALGELLTAAEVEPNAPTAILTDDGAGVVLRSGSLADTDPLAQMHARCSLRTLFSRYHSGVRSVPKRWLHRLLSPPRGSTVLAVCGHDVIGMAQLISTGNPHSAEVSLLVEDAWQRKGVGRALLLRAARCAWAEGATRLVAWCLPSEASLLRTAASAGLTTSTRTEMGLLRVTIDTQPPRHSSESVSVLP